MDYKQQIENAKRAAAEWREKNPIICDGEVQVDWMVNDLTASISDLLARAEAAEARVLELETTHRTEVCEDGYDCVQLGDLRKEIEWKDMVLAAMEKRFKAAEELANLYEEIVDKYEKEIVPLLRRKLEKAEAVLKGEQDGAV